MESKFRLNAAQFFLTYPQCPMTPNEALSSLQGILTVAKHKMTDYIIA